MSDDVKFLKKLIKYCEENELVEYVETTKLWVKLRVRHHICNSDLYVMRKKYPTQFFIMPIDDKYFWVKFQRYEVKD